MADRASYHATVNGDVVFTDNVFSEQRGRQDGDLFTQIQVVAEVTQYTLHGNPSLTGRAGWQGLFIPGPTIARAFGQEHAL